MTLTGELSLIGRHQHNNEDRSGRCGISWYFVAMAGSQLELPRTDRGVLTATYQVLFRHIAESSMV